MGSLLASLARWSLAESLLWGTVAALGVTGVSAFLRFRMGYRAAVVTRGLARFTGGWRIHHGYPGVLLMLVAALPVWEAGLRNLFLLVGWTLLLSDLLHHFAVLWPLTGSPQFDLRYRRSPPP